MTIDDMKQRAAEMAETHVRITEAAIELHGTVGPARTTLSAVAKQAGVERRTLYRHFPTDAELFEACSAHYFAAHPFPDPAGWRDLEHALDDVAPSTMKTPTAAATAGGVRVEGFRAGERGPSSDGIGPW